MSRRSLWLALIGFVLHSSAFAIVRTLSLDQNAMAAINLSMGRSTILHFTEKPTKIIAGNQNYFNVEFTGEDVTIQPLGSVTSNLFVYTEYHRYGFVLRVGGHEVYDDLVQIRWRDSHVLSPLAPKMKTKVDEEKKLPATKDAEVLLKKAFFDKSLSLAVIELEFKDKSGSGLTSKAIQISVTQGGKAISPRRIVFDREMTDSKDPVLKMRAFIEAQAKQAISVRIKIKSRETRLMLPGKVFE